jgi:hypothetical protein
MRFRPAIRVAVVTTIFLVAKIVAHAQQGEDLREATQNPIEGRHKGHHHYIDGSLVADVEGNKVRLSANGDVAVTMEQEG